MANPMTPTARRRRLGAELRKLRERAGITATEAAALLGGNQARISNIEAGRYGVSAERVRTLSRHYDCTDRALVDALAALTGERRQGWWEGYRGLLPERLIDLAEVEYHGTAFRTSGTLGVPELLQTTDYARESLRRYLPTLDQSAIEHRLSFRMKRQTVVFREGPPPFTALIHEAALHMPFEQSGLAAHQLRHLLTMGERDHIILRVVPFAAGHPGHGHAFSYVQADVPQLDTVHLDLPHGTLLLDAEPELRTYREGLDHLESLALSPSDSLSAIRDLTPSQ
ncbi:helix-turn-helix transcriptional regulator [uncultured Streptomyces sp.]|uniref:helix-turn-helix domain-containing protein n=1 Tax=uncultured Streptomyces sp. TaxID=174707 RepID=UPI00262C01F1|nr:helix-turn-helix transcriptional regulator [uncultured Streptomyces sp.]